MPTHDLTPWMHDHLFDKSDRRAARATRAVMWITVAMMTVEIIAGSWFNSVALQADGWHMSSHALAIGLGSLAYTARRTHAHDPRFTFGTWKIEVLGGFASAILLLGVAAMMVLEAGERILAPRPIHYREAIIVGVVGLIVNVVCALILGRAHQDHDGEHGSKAHHHDLNLRSAFIHVLADAATSVLAIVALLGASAYGWAWLDPVMAIVGAFLVAIWAKNLIFETANVLLDREMDHPVVDDIRDLVHALPGQARLSDLHVWRVG